ncbi:MAG: DUF4743 domain-containing protein [Thiothrix sp.]|nr:DUF4743 domain-containing protein [Thiothrix sp.]HPE60079.1 DUF4743 domain-containing protein [Thiolinea sp.]
MSYLDCIQRCNNAASGVYLPWYVEGREYGRIEPAFARRLQEWPQVFVPERDGVGLHADLQGYHRRSAAVEPVLRQLYQAGVMDTWVGEAYPVTLGFGEPAVLAVERAAASFLGIRSFGVHVNGLVRKGEGPDGVHVWLGTRTDTKPFWPGKLDQMVAGGQPVGIGLLDNIVKEAFEEAAVPEPLARSAVAAGQVHYAQSGWRGLDRCTLFLFDLWLPADFTPVNTDGEVAKFELLPLAEVAKLTREVEAFKDNCNLVNIDLLIRMGQLKADDPDYPLIYRSLYRGPTENPIG